MKIFTLSFIIIICSSVLLAQSNTGSVSGTVQTSDGTAAEFVNVTLEGTSKGTVADKQGNFKIGGLAPGSYTVVASFIGLGSQKQNVEVSAGQNVVVNFILKESSSQLQEVVIAGARDSYMAEKTSSSLRLSSSLLETPQNIQVVTSEVLRDQQAISMSDGLIRNVSGVVRSEHWGDMYVNLKARGSQLQAFRNGFNIVNSYWGPLTEDMAFVDHIEFVKGPAGFMLASGDPAGLFNVVTKKPTGITKGEASITMGSWGLFRSTLDLDGKLSSNGRLLYRLNLSAQNKNSFRPNEYNDRYVVAPVISYQLDDKTKLTLEYNYQRANTSDVGSFYVFSKTGYGSFARDFTTLPSGLPGTAINDHAVYMNIQHELDDHWKITGQVARFIYNMRGSSMWPTIFNDDGTFIRTVGIWDADSKMSLGQVFVNGEASTGSIRHRVLAGIDVGRKSYLADWGQSHNLDSLTHPFDPNHPDTGIPNNGYPTFDRTTPLVQRAQSANGVYETRYSSAYLQDELGFLDNKVRLTLALRYTNLWVVSYNGAPQKAEHLTPRAGLSVSITPTLSGYLLYDQAFLPQNPLGIEGGNVKPITGNNREVGFKKNWAGGWSTTLSAFSILKNDELTANTLTADPRDMISIGQKRSQGVEFDLRGSIIRGLNLIFNYAYMDSKVTKATPGVDVITVGDVVPGFAKQTFNTWLTYKIQSGALKGIGASVGYTFLLDRATYWEATPDPSKEMKDYFKMDAGLFWEKDRMRVTANVFNVLDAYLYSGSYESWVRNANGNPSPVYSYQAEAPRNVRFSISYRF
jgi:iron complex outermembrane receptor protein